MYAVRRHNLVYISRTKALRPVVILEMKSARKFPTKSVTPCQTQDMISPTPRPKPFHSLPRKILENNYVTPSIPTILYM
ncbi:hypothetical protein M426DRAFT_246650 [Hypoxylon sp. CI-4A]|nr:hypothetical protein M426DRAFT_246650 [Hypoxylon sp. CI-4A]